MALEIERKFLLLNDDWRSLVNRSQRMQQGYLSKGEQRSVRVRVSGDDEAFLNIKSARQGSGISRLEFEYAIPVNEAREILESVALKPYIDKTRFYIQQDEVCWEIDEFYGDNQGLIVAEIELPAEDYSFVRPDWLGKEVSDDPRYYNMNLMQMPFNQWPENQCD